MPENDDPKERTHSNDPLHGVSVKAMVTTLVEELGWEEMSDRVRINCFFENPSVNSTLKFLRKTPWARERVEKLYIKTMARKERFKQRGPAESSGESSEGDPQIGADD